MKDSSRSLGIIKVNYCSGIMMSPFTLSQDGFELQFATNYLGHFLLTSLLLPRMIAGAAVKPKELPSKIVTLSSLAHRLGNNFETFKNKI